MENLIAVIVPFISAFTGVLAGLPMINYRLKKLEEKQTKYNNVIERTFIMETKVDYIEKEMGELKHEREACKIN